MPTRRLPRTSPLAVLTALAALAALVAATSACFPPVTHGPRVKGGVSAGLTSALTRGDRRGEWDDRVREASLLSTFAGYGWVPPSRHRPRAYAGAALPLMIPWMAQLEGYVQAPPAWTGPLAAGVGAVVDLVAPTLYVQAGDERDQGIGWHVTGGYGRRDGAGSAESAAPAWIGAAALQLSMGQVHTHLFVQGALARRGRCAYQPAPPYECVPQGRDRALAVGASVVGYHRRARR